MKRMLWAGIILVALSIIAIGCGKSEKPKIPGEEWGEAVNGVAMRLTGPANVETDGIFEVTITLKNDGSKPIVIKDTTPESFACVFNITDQNGLSVQWLSNTSQSITPTIPPVTLGTDEVYRITKRLDRDGSFMPPVRGGMRLKISASYEALQTGVVANAWTGKITSNPLSVSIIDNTWGETVNGLHCYLARIPDSFTVTEPMFLDVVIENTDPLKPALLRASPDNKKKPQIDIEIIDQNMKTLFKSRRTSGPVEYITLNPGEKIYAIVVPISADISKKLTALNLKKGSYQKAMASDKKIKLSEIVPDRYSITAYYSHVTEKGKTYPKNWGKGWKGTIKSNTAPTNLNGGGPGFTLPVSESSTSPYVGIKTKSGKTKTIKNSKAVEDIRKSLIELKPLKKPSKAKISGTITVFADNSSTTYNYSSAYLESADTPGVQYQMPSALKKYLPQ